MSILKQIRKGIKNAVAINRERITLQRAPLITNPITGEQVRNPAGAKTSHSIYARIAHEKKVAPDDRPTPAGESTNLSRFILVEPQYTIVEHDTFTWQGKEWEVGPVDPVIIKGHVIEYQAPLKEA